MKKISKIKMKPNFIKFLKLFFIITFIILSIFLFYKKLINDITKHGYSFKASNRILFSFKKDYILSIGENKTLNKAFESNYLKEKYLDNYSNITYVNHKDLIKNINELLNKGYNNSEINLIITHGNNNSVKRFIKRDKIKYIEEFFTVSYAKLDNYDRYVNYSNETGEDEKTTVLSVNLDLDKKDYEESIKIDKFSIDMLINKHRYLSEEFIPKELISIPKEYTNEKLQCNKEALEAFKKMSKDAKKDGYEIIINSAYRSYEEQKKLEELYLKTYGKNYVDKYVPRLGYSEHQTGLAFDIGSRNTNIFINSKEYKWMEENAYKYGFIRRYKQSKEHITGFRNEPWHYRYVGKEVSKKIKEEKLTLEEYWAIYLDKFN